MSVLTTWIVFWGERVLLCCDGRCSKAWGINHRPRTQLSDDEDDIIWIRDSDLGEAPDDPGTYEGGHGKPSESDGPGRHNRWCARECERSSICPSLEEMSIPDLEHPEPNIRRTP